MIIDTDSGFCQLKLGHAKQSEEKYKITVLFCFLIKRLIAIFSTVKKSKSTYSFVKNLFSMFILNTVTLRRGVVRSSLPKGVSNKNLEHYG